MLMGVVIQRVEKRRTAAGQQRILMQQRRDGLESIALATAQDLFKIKTQQAVLRPLGSVEQQQLAVAQQQHKAGRLGLGKDAGGKQILPATRLPAAVLAQIVTQFWVNIGRELCLEQWQRERIATALLCIVGFGNPQPRAAIGTVVTGHQRQRRVVIQRLELWSQLITECLQQRLPAAALIS